MEGQIAEDKRKADKEEEEEEAVRRQKETKRKLKANAARMEHSDDINDYQRRVRLCTGDSPMQVDKKSLTNTSDDLHNTYLLLTVSCLLFIVEKDCK